MKFRGVSKAVWPLAIMIFALLLAACAPIQPAAEGETMGAGEQKTLFINSERVPCVGVAPMMCLQVRESEEMEWQNFFGGIDGFVFVPGYTYEIIVNVTEIDNPPADASSLLYTLVEVVSKTPDYSGDPVPLVGTEWQLRAFGDEAIVRYDETATPVTIIFNEDGSVNGNAGCNNFMGGFTDDGATLTFDPLASTMMMCDEAAMAVEQAFLSALQGTLDYTINGNMLEIVYAAGVLTFQAQGTGSLAEAPAEDAAEDAAGTEITLFVNSERVPCVGVGPMMCLQVRESEDEEWQFFYSGIDGFTFVPGYTYELIVNVTEVENPPADSSSLQYTLVQVVSKTPAYTGEPLPLVGPEWLLRAFGEEQMVRYDETTTPVTILFNQDGSVSGNAGCNNFTGGFTDDGATITVGPLATTMMMCPEEAMAVETAFLDGIQGTHAYTINGNMLEIVYAAGVLTFEAQETMAAAAPEAPATSEASPLEGTSWALTSLDGSMGIDFDPVATPVTLVFEDGNVAGVSGCNNYAGGYTVDGMTLTFGMLISTMMMCEDDAMAVEQAYLAALQSGPVLFEIDGDMLILTTSVGLLTFVDAAGTVQANSQGAPAAGAPAAEGDSLPLVGTTWTLVAMDEAMGVAFDPAVVTVDATFEADGSVYGTAGCNRFTGSYTSDDVSITFSPMAMTRMMCPEPMMDVERAVTAAVQGGVQYSISGNTLTLTTATGVLTFEG